MAFEDISFDVNETKFFFFFFTDMPIVFVPSCGKQLLKAFVVGSSDSNMNVIINLIKKNDLIL